MEKITKSFLALVLMFVGMVSALAQPVAPVAPEAPAAPKATALVTDGSVKQYLYNVGAKGFFIGANDWGTRASFSAEKGYWVQITKNATGDTYTLNNEGKGGNSADCQGVDQIWVDGAGRAGDGLWTVIPGDDNTFKLGNTNVANTYLSVVPSKNDTKLYMSNADEAQNVWIVVSEADYAAYQEAVPAYQAALKEYNDAYAQYQKEYAEWFKANYKAGESLLPLAPANWEGQGGNYTGLANPAKEKYVDGGNAPLKAGDVMTQTIEGLKNGKYIVLLEAAGSYTSGRGFECPTGDGLAVAFANDVQENLPIVDRGWVGEGEQNFYTFEVEVTDGTLKYGVKNLADAGNWYVIRLADIAMIPEKETWFTENLFCYKDKTINKVDRDTEVSWTADPKDVANGCIKIVAGIKAGAETQDDHNTQFWIRGAEVVDANDLSKGAFAKGTGFKVTFKVKADGEYEVLPGYYRSKAGSTTAKNDKNAWNHISYFAENLKVTTEWQTVSYVCMSPDDLFTSFGLNLADKTNKTVRTFYFDDVKIEGRGGSEWYVNYGDIHAKDFKKDNPEDPDPVYADSDNPYPLARFVADDGVGYVEVVTNAKRNNPWDSQIWIGIPSEYVGKITKMTMQVWADEAVTCSESYHATATGKGWGASAKINEGKGLVTEADKWIDITRILNTKDVKCNGVYKNMQVDYYCLDLSNDAQNEGDGVIYRFRNLKFEPSAEDWYTSNVFTVDGEEAPYIYGTGEEGGYVEVAGGKKLTFGIPEALQGGDVKISMKVKAAADDATTDITYTTAWADASIIVEAAGATYDLTLPAAGTFDFDEIAFEKYYKPIDYGKLVEIPVEGTLVKERDFTTATSWTHNPSWASNKEGYTDKLIVGEGLEIVNNADQGMWESQFFIIEDVPLQADKDYAVRYTLKYDGEGGDMQINLQAGDWSTNNQAVYPLAAGPIYTQMVHTALGWTKDVNANVFFQSGAIKGRMIVEKVEVFDITPDYAGMAWSDNILKNGDLKSDDMSEFFVKNNDVEDPETLTAEKTAIGEGAYEIDIETAARPAGEKEGEVGGNDYDAQFYIRLPYVLPKGSFFNLEFDIYAEASNTIAIQANVEPGQYKGNLASVKTDASGEGVVHFQKYLRAPEDMRTIAFNLAVATDATYGFSNMKVQIVNDDKAAIDEATQTADATTLWAETLALNEACYAGRTADTEGCSEESVKALTDAVAAGKAELANAEATKETLAAAAKAIEDALAALRGGEGEYLPAPDLTDLIEIAQAQDEPAGSGNPLASKEVIQVEGVDVTNYVTKGDICVVFKMLNIDVKNTDYITIKFAQPTPKGLCVSFWNGTKNVELPEGVSEYNYVYDEDAANDIVDDVIPQVAIISLWNPDVKLSVYGVYKHKVPVELAYTDLTPEMFFQWSATDETAEAISTSPCDYNIATSTGQPYGLSTVNEDRFADLSAYSTIELTATEGEPRLLFNRLVAEGTVYAEVPRDKDKYETVVDNGDGSKTYIVDIAAIVAEYGFAHLHAIKGANWQNTTVNSIKLGYVGEKPALPVPTNIFEVADDAAVKDGKYFINGQIVIVKNGVKYNAAGQVIE